VERSPHRCGPGQAEPDRTLLLIGQRGEDLTDPVAQMLGVQSRQSLFLHVVAGGPVEPHQVLRCRHKAGRLAWPRRRACGLRCRGRSPSRSLPPGRRPLRCGHASTSSIHGRRRARAPAACQRPRGRRGCSPLISEPERDRRGRFRLLERLARLHINRDTAAPGGRAEVGDRAGVSWWIPRLGEVALARHSRRAQSRRRQNPMICGRPLRPAGAALMRSESAGPARTEVSNSRRLNTFGELPNDE
jgi:hypothetical protein